MSQVSDSMRLEVIEHLNQTHRQDLTQLAQAFGAAPWATDAEILDFDFMGVTLDALHGSSRQSCQIAFATPAQAESEIEELFLDVVEAAKNKLGIPSETKIITDLIGTATHSLPFSSQMVFTALCAVQDYPKWLPPIGQVQHSSHAALQTGSSFSATPRGQKHPMQVNVLEYQENAVLHWCENGEYAHAMRFLVEPNGASTALTVSISNRVPVAPSEQQETQQKLGTLALMAAKKLEVYLDKGEV